jgi:hypothetical protein
MQLTPRYKKLLIIKVTESIFLSFNKKTYNEALAEIVRNTGLDNNIPDAISIHYLGEYYTPFNLGGHKFVSVRMTEDQRQFPRFKHLQEVYKNYQKLTAIATNYLRNGLAMCQTSKCMCLVFPEFILNKINEVNIDILAESCCPTLQEKETVNPKFLAFKTKNEQVVISLKKQLVYNLLTQGNTDGQPSL